MLIFSSVVSGLPYSYYSLLQSKKVIVFVILVAKGVAHKGTLVKVLARGTISTPVKVSAHAVSKAAEQAIVAAGGTVTLLPLPHKIRPAAKGNQFTNR